MIICADDALIVCWAFWEFVWKCQLENSGTEPLLNSGCHCEFIVSPGNEI